MALAGVMWLVLFLVPFLKYPANPPGVGDTETVDLRTTLYIALTAASGLSALGFWVLSRRLAGRRRLLPAAGYGILMALLIASMPPSPDVSDLPVELLEGFRAMSVLAVSSYWFFLPLFFGLLWARLRPDRPLATS